MTPTMIDPIRLGALERVRRGEIGAIRDSGVLVREDGELAPEDFGALYALRREGYVALNSTRPDTAGWITAELTDTGEALLAAATTRSRPARGTTRCGPNGSARDHALPSVGPPELLRPGPGRAPRPPVLAAAGPESLGPSRAARVSVGAPS